MSLLFINTPVSASCICAENTPLVVFPVIARKVGKTSFAKIPLCWSRSTSPYASHESAPVFILQTDQQLCRQLFYIVMASRRESWKIRSLRPAAREARCMYDGGGSLDPTLPCLEQASRSTVERYLGDCGYVKMETGRFRTARAVYKYDELVRFPYSCHCNGPYSF